MIFDRSQLLRGTLEGCILKIISLQTTYGYEIMERLKKNGFDEISEGTIYPLLLRLEKQGSISSSLLPSPLGPRENISPSPKRERHTLKASRNVGISSAQPLTS